MVDEKWLRKNFTKKYIASQIDLYTVGRNLKEASQRIGNRILRAIFKKIIDHLMESNRVNLGRGRYFYIGKGKPSRHYHQIRANPNTYVVKLSGTGNDIHFRMPGRRRKELRERLKNGQKFLS